MNETGVTGLPSTTSFFNDTSTPHEYNNTSSVDLYGLDSTTYRHLLYGMIVFSGLTMAVNLVILTATKFTKAGKSATLVFIRSLCVADMLIGLFGMLKSFMLNSLSGRIINCFLPESVLLSSCTTICLTLLWVNVDSYLRLVRPLRYANTMDKTNVIMAMMVLWNGSFIIGFLPLMGWSSDTFVCNFFHFYNPVYITILAGLWLASTIASCLMQLLLRNVLTRIRENSNFMPATSMEFKKYSHLVAIIRINLTLWMICYLPCVFYIIVSFSMNEHENLDKLNSNLIFFLPIFLLRSFLCAFMHSYKTVRIQKILRGMTNSVSKCTRNDQISTDDSSEAISSICDKSACRRCSYCSEGRVHLNSRRAKRVLCAAPSVITIAEEESVTTRESTTTTLRENTTLF